MKLRELFSIIYSLIIILLVVLMSVTVFMHWNSNKLIESNSKRYKSFQIAQELKNSSDDLTRFCRTYVETGDSIWEKRFWKVLEVRNGLHVRPNGRMISLHDTMKKLGFTDIEFNKLQEAEKKSNDLVWTEKVAFNALKGRFADNNRQFTILNVPDTNLARTILFDKKYHDDKSKIMDPIDDCINRVIFRTKNEVEQKTETNRWLLLIVVSLILLISVISIVAFFLIRNKIIFQMEEQKASKEQAEKNEAKFRLLFEKSPDVITITNEKGNFIECNQAFFDFHKIRSLDELSHIDILEIYVNVEDRQKLITQLINDGAVRNKEISFKSLNGSEVINCLVSSELVRYTNNETVFISWIRNISEKKQMESDMMKLSTAIDQNPAAIVITDLNGNIEYVNSQFSKLTGYSEHELLGKNPRILKTNFHPQEFYAEMWETILSGKVWKGEIYNKRKDGTCFWEDSTFAPIFDKNNEIVNLVGIKQNITEKKEAEFVLMEREKELQILNNTKNRLFSIIGHDLRNPIGVLHTFIEVMLSDVDLTDTKKIKEMLELLHASTSVTNDLLENLLLWARNQQQEVVFEPTDINLHRIVVLTSTLMAVSLKNKNITIHNTIPEDFTVKADNNMIMAVIRNLVMNGIKFTNNDKNIYVSATEGSEFYTISVKDEGLGIKPENIKKLFNPSELFSNFGTSGEKGTGLGLLLCKDYIERHGGTIWVESEEGVGSEFTFTLSKTLV